MSIFFKKLSISFSCSGSQFENNGQMQPTLWRHRRLQSEIRALRVCILLLIEL